MYSPLIQILRKEPANCEAIYLKAKTLKMQGQFEAAIELYEHVISLGKSETSTIKSIYDMALIRVAERDFYLAYYTLDRIEEIPKEIEYLYQLKVFLDGAVNMIKKKYKAGLDNLAAFDKSKINDADVGRLSVSLMAFGHFNLGEIGPALELYKQLEAEGLINEGDVYNKEICRGILSGEAGEYLTAEKHFRKAEQLNRLKVEPYFYIAVGWA
jgi:tetratricopeptide (TPR) repeat protein